MATLESRIRRLRSTVKAKRDESDRTSRMVSSAEQRKKWEGRASAYGDVLEYLDRILMAQDAEKL